MKKVQKKDIKKVEDYLWEVPNFFREVMLVPSRILAFEHMLDDILKDSLITFFQYSNSFFIGYRIKLIVKLTNSPKIIGRM